MNIEAHLLQRATKDFNFTDVIGLFERCKNERALWEAQAEIGLLIYNNEYLKNRKLESDTSNQSDFYSINFVKDNLMLAVNEALIPEIDVRLFNNKNAVEKIQDILELEINYVIDKEQVTDDMKQILIANKFMGFACGKTFWSEENPIEGWWTGSPKHKPIDPRKIWYISTDNLETKKDIVGIFHREQYTLETFKLKYPEYYEKYGMAVTQSSEEDLGNNYYYNMGIVNVMVYQYKKSYKIKERVLANEESESMKVNYFTEDEYEELLREKGASDENMDIFKETGEVVEDTPIFPEKIRVTKPITRTETRWFQVMFIPELKVQLEEIELVGKESDYMVMPGMWNPDNVYSTSEAYNYKELLKISGVLLTTMVLNTVKLQKPIPVVIEGALKNEATFLRNYHKLGVIAKVDSEWARKNPTAQAVRWLAPPQSGQMQAMLFQMIEKLIDKSMSAPNVSRGIPDYSQQSGKQTELLQMQAKVSTKPDYYAVERYLTAVAERFKYMIATKRNYPHQMFMGADQEIEGLTEQQGTYSKADVNTNDENKLSDIADSCYARVNVESNIDQKNQIQDMNYEKLYAQGDLPFSEFIMNQSWAKNPEKILEAHQNAQGDRAIAEALSENPELKQQVLMLMQQNPDMEAKQPSNVQTQNEQNQK